MVAMVIYTMLVMPISDVQVASLLDLLTSQGGQIGCLWVWQLRGQEGGLS